MKILTISVIPVSKTAEMSALADKITAERPPDVSDVAQYICLSPPFDGIPPNSMVTISIAEVGSSESLAMSNYPLQLAGGEVRRIPIMEIPVGTSTETEKKYRG